jgi:hypothetical protein
MIDENYFPFSLNSYEESYQEDAFCQIFNPVLEPLDIKDEINPDKVYFVNGKDDSTNRNSNNNYEDFDQFYKKFAEIEEQNEVREDNIYVNPSNEKPSFCINLSQEAIFSSFENEILINVIIPNEYTNPKAKFEAKIIEEDNDNLNNENSTFAKPKSVKKKSNDENYYFPFTPPKGIINGYNLKSFDELNSNGSNLQTQTVGLEDEEKNLEENSEITEQVNNSNPACYDFKFKTKKYCIMPNGKKRREKKKRKFKSDDIRKKIKSRFHKTLKNIVNEKLKNAGSKKFFDFLPQCFIGNIAKKPNSQNFDLTYKELFSINFIKEMGNDKNFKDTPEYKKFLKNKEALEYLEKNKEISKSSGFDIIKDKKYKDLLKIYFSSWEFENSILRLKQENEGSDYIQEYIFRAKHYVDFYCNDNNSEEKNELESEDE